MEEGWFTKILEGSHGVGLWKAFRKESPLLKNNCIFILGDGRRLTFWEDVCCRKGTLKEMFPNLYNLTETRRAFIAEMWSISMGGGTLNPMFGRNLNDWEQNFLTLINSRRVNQRTKDRLCWKGDKSGCYFVKKNVTMQEMSLYNSSTPVPVKICGTVACQPRDAFSLGGVRSSP